MTKETTDTLQQTLCLPRCREDTVYHWHTGISCTYCWKDTAVT